MTTPINNFQDILDALRHHILTEELLQVPARLERMEGDIGSLREDVTALKGGHERLEQKFDGLEKKVDQIGGDVSRLTGKDYESHVAAYVHRSLQRDLGMNAAVFSTQSDKPPSPGSSTTPNQRASSSPGTRTNWTGRTWSSPPTAPRTTSWPRSQSPSGRTTSTGPDSWPRPPHGQLPRSP